MGGILIGPHLDSIGTIAPKAEAADLRACFRAYARSYFKKLWAQFGHRKTHPKMR